MILDGDMQTNYIFDEEKLTVQQEKDISFMKECVKEAYGVEVPAYFDGGSGGKREDQEICAYRKYLEYYMSSVFYLPNNSIPEKIILESKYAQQQYGDIIKTAREISNDNAKDILLNISKFDYGDECHVNDLIQKLSYKWSQECSLNKESMEVLLEKIYNVEQG